MLPSTYFDYIIRRRLSQAGQSKLQGFRPDGQED